jgi:hypothetical protein
MKMRMVTGWCLAQVEGVWLKLQPVSAATVPWHPMGADTIFSFAIYGCSVHDEPDLKYVPGVPRVESVA